ncbi:MAG: hypothetical protein IJU51_02845, partial [Clostridia bacterium]|nr:hypothetical protein [Clostridia bacterium]
MTRNGRYHTGESLNFTLFYLNTIPQNEMFVNCFSGISRATARKKLEKIAKIVNTKVSLKPFQRLA